MHPLTSISQLFFNIHLKMLLLLFLVVAAFVKQLVETHLDHWVLAVVAAGVLGVPAPILHIDLWHS